MPTTLSSGLPVDNAMANKLESPTPTTAAVDRSTFQNLIRKLAEMPTTLKAFSLSDNNEDSYQFMDKHHPIRKFIPNIFLSDPPIDPHPLQDSRLETGEMPTDSCNRRTNNLILEGFLKNNGGYLDDSGSSSSGSSDADEEASADDQDHRQYHHPSGYVKQGYNINFFAKKHQPESTDQSPNTIKRNSHPHSFNLSKKLLNLHFTNKSDHRKPATVVLNKPVHQAPITADLCHDCHYLESSNVMYYHHHHTAKPYINHIETCQAPKPSQGRFDTNDHRYKHHEGLAPQDLSPEVSRTYKDERRWYGFGDRRKWRETGDLEDEMANHNHLQSSTSPAKNSSLLDSQYSLNSPQPSNHDSQSPISGPPHSTHLSASSESTSVFIDHHHHHTPDFDKFKSPFRKLVLGEDDLLRSN
ncbi:hypothetical protein MJO28_005175 [Puccinia striiformis f. sp. tritici]|uniref:Uncharacterized protein n=1 Tax=Puccinia striiformis f. sp. tritici TaxID=168172 RepID=A0ACC0EJZ6_9BASI|nr:hypothetical protein MJO28_005175 [Puccinia striiformis f. sp. tritici]KAI7960163.1 hypothetical protein MJO29_005231 [Puccinia striiformis f. sp. tritici]